MNYDFANLPISMTGIDGISTKDSGICRIMYYKESISNGSSFSVVIPELRIADNRGDVALSIKKEVLMFAYVNMDKLLKFWNNGSGMMQDDVISMQQSMRLTEEDLSKSQSFEIVNQQLVLPIEIEI